MTPCFILDYFLFFKSGKIETPYGAFQIAFTENF